MQAPTVTVNLFLWVDIDLLGHLEVHFQLYHILSINSHLALLLDVDTSLFWPLLSDSVYTHSLYFLVGVCLNHSLNWI